MNGRPRVLFLLNGPNRDPVDHIGRRFEAAGLDPDYRWAWQDDFPADPHGYDAMFLSGSPHGAYEDVPFIHREHALVADVVERGVPVLGVCFGSQMLASALCGRDQVFRRSTCDVGHARLRSTAAACEDRIARHLPPRFPMFVWHNDEVRAEHPDMVILASSDACPNQVWRFRDRPVWGIQGHPEVNPESARQWLEERRPRLARDGADVDALIGDAGDVSAAETLFENFIALVREHRGEATPIG